MYEELAAIASAFHAECTNCNLPTCVGLIVASSSDHKESVQRKKNASLD
jgi:hypothetical protein